MIHCSVCQDSSALFLADHDICKERISSYSRFVLMLCTGAQSVCVFAVQMESYKFLCASASLILDSPPTAATAHLNSQGEGSTEGKEKQVSSVASEESAGREKRWTC